MPLDELVPNWFVREAQLASMLPYVSLVDDHTIRTRSNELFQCIRLDGLNSSTETNEDLAKFRDLFASTIKQIGAGYTFYVHKVSKPIDVSLPKINGDTFANDVDAKWQASLGAKNLRDKSLTLTIVKRPLLPKRMALFASRSITAMQRDTEAQVTELNEVVSFFKASFAELNPRLLSAETGELLGFLAALNTGRETPIFPSAGLGLIACDVANTRVTFRKDKFELKDGAGDGKFGQSFAIKNYPASTLASMLDELTLPIDMVITQSFTPVHNSMMIHRIKHNTRMRMAFTDSARTFLSENEEALDDLETGAALFGEHHMTVSVFANSEAHLAKIAAEIRAIAASSGITLISETFAARTHYFAQHPGNGAMRSRKATITALNFADFSAFHRTQLGKEGKDTPWGMPISIFPTPERSAYRFSFHEKGRSKPEPTGGHSLVLGRPGSGKSVLTAFLMTQAKRAGARVIVFDYRMGMEMAVRANGGRYSTIKAGQATGLNPLWTETDTNGQAWLTDWLSLLLNSTTKPLTPTQTNQIGEIVRQNAAAENSDLRNWSDLASLAVATDDDGDLFERFREWTTDGRFGWIFGQSLEDTFSLKGDMMGFDLTGILDSENDKERMAVLSYLFRRVERVIEDKHPTIVVIDEAWKALDNGYFAARLKNWLVTARKQNAVVVMLTQYASQLEASETGRTIVEAVPTQVLLPNVRAKGSDYDLLNLNEKELAVLLHTGSNSRLALVRDDQGSVVVDTNLSALGNALTILGGLEAGEQLVGKNYRENNDFWRI